jgi:hypothetical protein
MAVSFICVFIVDIFQSKKNLISLLVIISVLFTSRHYYLFPTQFSFSQPSDSLTTQNEYDTIWMNNNTFNYRQTVYSNLPIQVLNLKSDTLDLSFRLDAPAGTVITIRRLFFPGWELKVNEKAKQFFQVDGLISFVASEPISDVILTFKESQIRKISDFFTLTGILIFLILFIFSGKRLFKERL